VKNGVCPLWSQLSCFHSGDAIILPSGALSCRATVAVQRDLLDLAYPHRATTCFGLYALLNVALVAAPLPCMLCTIRATSTMERGAHGDERIFILSPLVPYRGKRLTPKTSPRLKVVEAGHHKLSLLAALAFSPSSLGEGCGRRLFPPSRSQPTSWASRTGSPKVRSAGCRCPHHPRCPLPLRYPRHVLSRPSRVCRRPQASLSPPPAIPHRQSCSCRRSLHLLSCGLLGVSRTVRSGREKPTCP